MAAVTETVVMPPESFVLIAYTVRQPKYLVVVWYMSSKRSV